MNKQNFSKITIPLPEGFYPSKFDVVKGHIVIYLEASKPEFVELKVVKFPTP